MLNDDKLGATIFAQHKKMQIPTPSMDNANDLPEEGEIFILASDGDGLVMRVAPARFYCRSQYCRKMYVTLPEAAYLHYGIPADELVLVLRDTDYRDLLITPIVDVPQLLAFLRTASRLSIDLFDVENDMFLTGFIIAWQRQSVMTWRNNAELLHNTDTQGFLHFHFEEVEPEPEPDAEAESDAIPNFELGAAADLGPRQVLVPGNFGAGNYFPAPRWRNKCYGGPHPYMGTYDFSATEGKYASYNRQYRLVIEELGKPSITQECVSELIDLLVEMELDSVIMSLAVALLVDIVHCHLILNYHEFGSIISAYPEVSQYVFYAMRILYLEERGRIIYTQPDDRFLFVMDVDRPAVRLPLFSFGIDHPYISCLIGQNGWWGGQFIEPCFINGSRGIQDFTSFLARLEAYSGGVLAGLDWRQTAVCGSAMVACLMVNPLERYFNNFSEYINEYYPGRPFVAGRENIPRRRRNQRRLFALFESRKGKEHDIADEDEESASTLDPDTGDYSDIDIMIQTETMEEFEEIVARHFEVVCRNTILPVKLQKVYTENKYKFRVTGLPREIEFFQVNSIPGVIAKFHLGCVRAYYDGSTVRMFPSFITAAHTGINMDVRWVSCNKDLRNVILRYYQRGYTTLLNSKERDSIMRHMFASPIWPKTSTLGVPRRFMGWRRFARNRGTKFAAVARIMFNPSISKVGIGYNIKQKPRRIEVTFSENLHAYGRKKSVMRTPQGVRLPTITF